MVWKGAFVRKRVHTYKAYVCTKKGCRHVKFVKPEENESWDIPRDSPGLVVST